MDAESLRLPEAFEIEAISAVQVLHFRMIGAACPCVISAHVVPDVATESRTSLVSIARIRSRSDLSKKRASKTLSSAVCIYLAFSTVFLILIRKGISVEGGRADR